MSSAARDMRARGKDVDYSDFYTPEEPKRRKKFTVDDDFSDDDDDDSDANVVLPLKRSKAPGAAAKAKAKAKPKVKVHKTNKGTDKSATSTAAVVKPKKKKSDNSVAVDSKKTKKRALTVTSDDDEVDDDDDDTYVPKPVKKAKRDAEQRAKSDATAVKKMKATSKKLLAAAKAVSTNSTTSTSTSAPTIPPSSTTNDPLVPAAGDSNDPTAFRRKYEALRQLRATESEQLLVEAKALAREEQQTYERIVETLKREVAVLSDQLRERERAHAKAIKTLAAEHQSEVDALEQQMSNASSKSDSRRRIEELEAQLRDARQAAKAANSSSSSSSKSSKSKSARSADAKAAADATNQLAQATKLLEIYRLVTSTDIRLIETLGSDDDDAAAMAYTDVTCATTDSDTGRQFHFDLGVPRSADDEIEYLPSETPPSRDCSVPSYLQDELSFKRPEMTKFLRTVLDVVIRKKAPDARPKR